MFPFYCNQCFRRRKYEISLQLFVSPCGHILCNDCVQENCCICGRPFKSVAVNKDMPISMADYFASPMQQYQHYKKVMKFQHEQERRLVDHLCRLNSEENKKVQSEILVHAKLDDLIIRQIEQDREKIRKLEEYTAYNKRHLEPARYMTPPITSPPRPRYPPRSQSAGNAFCNPMNIRFSQPIRPNLIFPNRTTMDSNNTSSVTTEGTTGVKKRRTLPPLMPFSQHKVLNPQFSFNSLE